MPGSCSASPEGASPVCCSRQAQLQRGTSRAAPSGTCLGDPGSHRNREGCRSWRQPCRSPGAAASHVWSITHLAGSPLCSGLLPPAEKVPGEMAPGTGRQLRRAHGTELGAQQSPQLSIRGNQCLGGSQQLPSPPAASPEGLPARSSPQQQHVSENSPRAAWCRAQRPHRVMATGWGPRSSEAGISSWNGHKACLCRFLPLGHRLMPANSTGSYQISSCRNG